MSEIRAAGLSDHGATGAVSRRSWQWLAFCFVFYGIPAVVLLVAFRLDLLRSIQTSVEEQFRRLEQRLSRVAALRSPQHYLTSLLDRELALARHDPMRRNQILSRLRRRLPPGAQLMALDSGGTPIAAVSDPLATPDQARWILSVYRAGERVLRRRAENGGTPLTAIMDRLRAVLRAPLLEGLGADHFWPASRDPQRSQIYCEEPGPHGMTIVTVPSLERDPLVGVRDQMARYNRPGRAARFSLIDMRTWQTSEGLATHVSDVLPRAVLELSRTADSRVRLADWMFVGTPLGETHQLVCFAPAPVGVDRDARWLAGLAGAGLTVVVLMIVTHFLWVSRDRWRLSLRLKLLLLFLYGAGLPLSLLWVAGRQHVATQAAAFEQRHVEELCRYLKQTDAGFRRFIGRRETTLLGWSRRPASPPGNLVKVVTARLRWLIREHRAVAELFDANGRAAGVAVASSSQHPGSMGLLRTPVLLAMAATNPAAARRLEDTNKTFVEAIVAANPVFQAVDRTTSALVGRFAEANLGGRMLMLTCALPDPDGVARHAAMVYWPEAWVAVRYLCRALDEIEARHPGVYMTARLDNDLLWTIWHRPVGRAWRLPLAAFDLHLDTPGVPFPVWIPANGGRILVVGMRSVTMDRLQLLVRMDDREVVENTQRIRVEMLRLGLFLLLLVIGPGVLAVPWMMAPIAHLQEGIAAMAERRLRVQIPVVGDDEFGALSRAFNTMLAGMADLDLAGAIQHHLMPREAAGAGAVAIFGSCLPATEVGGDYLDYRLLDDGRWLIVVGDVVGHGAAAGMVMAMVEAVVVHRGTSHGDPAAVLTTIDHVLKRVVAGRRMMTCCAAVIDADGSGVTVACGGHWPPLVVRGGVVTELTVSGFPLGVMRPMKWSSRRFELRRGDRLLFLSDGLVETPCLGGSDEIGVDRLWAALPRLLPGDPVTAERNVRQWFRDLAGSAPPPDDVTIAVVAIG